MIEVGASHIPSDTGSSVDMFREDTETPGERVAPVFPFSASGMVGIRATRIGGIGSPLGQEASTGGTLDGDLAELPE